MSIYKMQRYSDGAIVEIDDSQAIRDSDNNSISKYFVDLHGIVVENSVNTYGYVVAEDVGKIIQEE